MAADLVIGLDSSTTACKAIAWDRFGRPVAEGRAELAHFRPRPAWHEQPAEAWWQAAAGALRQLTGKIDPGRVAALCMAAQRETFVPVDRDYRALRPAILWMDERCRTLLPGLEKQLGKERVHQLTGKPLSGNLATGKIAWLREFEPEVFRQTAFYLDVHAYLAYCLTGRAATSWGCADPLGLFEMQRGVWAEPVLAEIGTSPDQFPEALPVGSILGEVTAEAALVCGLPAGVLVVVGIGDGQACGLGAGVSTNRESYLNLGTAVISGTYTDHFVVSPAYRTMFSGIPGSFYLETVLLGGAYTVSWFMDTFGFPDNYPTDSHLTREAAWEAAGQEIPPGALGLMLVPYWNSAMNPYWDAAASGVVAGWRGVHGRPHLYRAILEGIAFEQRLLTAGVESATGQPIERYIAVGGGARNDLWCQIMADVTGRSVQRSATVEAAALGAGILAACGAGFYPTVGQAVAAMTRIDPRRFDPDSSRHAIYSRLFDEVYRHLFPALQPYLQRLAELVENQG